MAKEDFSEFIEYTPAIPRELTKHNYAKNLHKIFEYLEPVLSTSYLDKRDIIERMSTKIPFCAMVYDVLVKMGFDEKTALKIATMPLYSDINNVYLHKSWRGFIVRKLSGTSEEYEDEAAQRRFFGFAKKE